jgi:hypothetical protein
MLPASVWRICRGISSSSHIITCCYCSLQGTRGKVHPLPAFVKSQSAAAAGSDGGAPPAAADEGSFLVVWDVEAESGVGPVLLLARAAHCLQQLHVANVGRQAVADSECWQVGCYSKLTSATLASVVIPAGLAPQFEVAGSASPVRADACHTLQYTSGTESQPLSFHESCMRCSSQSRCWQSTSWQCSLAITVCHSNLTSVSLFAADKPAELVPHF